MLESYKEVINGHEFWMLPVQGGPFLMGSPNGEADAFDYERPQHKVTVPDFYLGKYPVTQALWKAIMQGENPSSFQDDDRPVERVSWDDAQAFIKQLNELTTSSRPTDHFYRLPTEAEWEYAARGGPHHAEGYKYAGSDRLKDVAWFKNNSEGETKPVGLKYANQLGLHDMSGNVHEWCEDDWRDNYNGAPSDGTAWVDRPQRGASRVDRGGSWVGQAHKCRVACRHDYPPGSRWSLLGFRLALAPQSVG